MQMMIILKQIVLQINYQQQNDDDEEEDEVEVEDENEGEVDEVDEESDDQAVDEDENEDEVDEVDQESDDQTEVLTDDQNELDEIQVEKAEIILTQNDEVTLEINQLQTVNQQIETTQKHDLLEKNEKKQLELKWKQIDMQKQLLDTLIKNETLCENENETTIKMEPSFLELLEVIENENEIEVENENLHDDENEHLFQNDETIEMVMRKKKRKKK